MSDNAKWLRSLDDPDMVGKSVTPWMLTQFTAAAAELDAERALADDLADVLDSVNLHKAPEVRRVLARYRKVRNQGEPT